jgi:hypothetical protein
MPYRSMHPPPPPKKREKNTSTAWNKCLVEKSILIDITLLSKDNARERLAKWRWIPTKKLLRFMRAFDKADG